MASNDGRKQSSRSKKIDPEAQRLKELRAKEKSVE